MLCGIGLRFNLLRNGVLAGVSDKRSLEDRELPDGAHHVLDSVGAGERAPQRWRKADPINSHHLVEPLEDTGGKASRSRQQARLRNSRSALSASSSSQACRSAWRTEACNDYEIAFNTNMITNTTVSDRPKTWVIMRSLIFARTTSPAL
jgi:hypothetical protein